MKSFLTLILFLLTLSCKGQIIELGYGPKSVQGWGNLPETTKFNASILFPVFQWHAIHYLPGMRYAHLHSKSILRDQFGEKIDGTFDMFFLIPASFNLSLGKIGFLERIGMGWSDEPFPNSDGLRFNFLLEAGARISLTHIFSLSLRYSHISNGFRGKINPGLDNIIVAAGFYF